jgi:hypothetical protein
VRVCVVCRRRVEFSHAEVLVKTDAGWMHTRCLIERDDIARGQIPTAGTLRLGGEVWLPEPTEA